MRYQELATIKKEWAFAFAFGFFCLFYLPWFFPFGRLVPIHDNLDGEVVVNYIIGQTLLGSDISRSLALNGALPAWSLSRLMQPLAFLYSLFDAWVAYALTDIIVRSVALVGFYLLACRIGLRPFSAVLIGIAFATSISYTIFLLSVAGIPLILWLLLKASESKDYQLTLIFIVIFFIGTNISFALSGLFLCLLLLPLIVYGFKQKLTTSNLAAFVALLSGIVVGNGNLFYAQFFSDITWHRSEWRIFRESDYSLALNIIKQSGSALLGNHWYHVSYRLQIAIIGLVSLFVFFKRLRDQNIAFMLSLLACFLVVYVFSTTSLSDPLRDRFSLFRSFQWDRFYFLYSTVVFITLMLMLKASENNGRYVARGVLIIISLQLVSNISHTPLIREIAKLALGKSPTPTFEAYYRRSEYAFIREAIGSGPVLSVGLDPMIAPMNGIPSIDGYYVLYPLAYKKAFRDVIDVSMTAAGKGDYFDEWGNRVYAFYPKGNPNLINFCAAHDLGAKYVISSEAITNALLIKLEITELADTLHVYQIKNANCKG
jgi:hypothetical protein